jgi:hypothetical protein
MLHVGIHRDHRIAPRISKTSDERVLMAEVA